MTKANVPEDSPTTEDKVRILSVLKKTSLFDGVSPAILKELAEKCTIRKRDFNKVIWSDKRQLEREKKEVGTPVMIVAAGCAAVLELKDDPKHEVNRINALTMPRQLLGEFQFVKVPWPEKVEIRSFGETWIISIEPNDLVSIVGNKELIYHNIARMLVEKIYIANRRLLITSISDVKPKVAAFLEELPEIPKWDQICRDSSEFDGYEIDINWSCTYLSHILLCDVRRIPDSLAKLWTSGAIDLTFPEADPERLLPKAVKTIKEYAGNFKITVRDRDKLRIACESKRTKKSKK